MERTSSHADNMARWEKQSAQVATSVPAQKNISTISIEAVNNNGEAVYLVASMNKDKVKPLFTSPTFKETLSKANVTATGNVYIAEVVNEVSPMWSTNPAKNSELYFKTTEFDILSEQYFSFDEKKKVIEKELKFLLKSAPFHQIKGEEYGGYDEFTESTSLSYSTLYDLFKQKVMSLPGGQKILTEMQQEEIEMAKPHKGSSKTFKVFRLGVKDEFEKVWRE